MIPDKQHPRRWWGLFVMLTAPFLGSLDFNIVNVSVPSIQAGIGASFAEIQLVMAGYGLAYGVALITGGRLGDIYGRRKTFIFGMTGFALSSALCGLATTPRFLIASRILQGFAAAMMFPQALSHIQVSFAEGERSLAFGAFGMILGLGSLSGNIVSGLLERFNILGLTWRPIFLVNPPICVMAILAALLLVPESRSQNSDRLDLPGALLVMVGLFLLIYPLAMGREAHWPSWSFMMLAASAMFIATFIQYEKWKSKHNDSPLVHFTLFKHRQFTAGLLVAFTFFMGLAAIMLIITVFMQLSLFYSPLKAGLLICPYAFSFLITSLLSAKLAPKLGHSIVQVGTVFMMLGIFALVLMAQRYGIHSTPWMIGISLSLYGGGQGLAQPPLVSLILSGVSNENAGSAAGVVSTIQQVAYAVGVAIIGSAFFGWAGERPMPPQYAEAFAKVLVINGMLAALTFVLVFSMPAKVELHLGITGD